VTPCKRVSSRHSWPWRQRPRIQGAQPPEWANTNFQLRKAIQHAAKDDAGDSDGRVQRVADQVLQPVTLQPVDPGHVVGVHEDQHVQRLSPFPEDVKLGLVEVLAIGVAADLDRGKAELAVDPLQLGSGLRRSLERHLGHAQQMSLGVGHVLGGGVVG
jgi:hypothetical protein